MMRLYSKKRTARILRRCGGILAEIEHDYGVPAACMQAVLWQEIPQIDLWDLAADCAVGLYWARCRLRGRLFPAAPLPRPLLGKRDCSTGYAQVFAATAIASIRLAAKEGAASPEALGLPRLPTTDDLGLVWRRLHRDRRFNLRCAALTLLAAAHEVTGRMRLAGCSPEEWERIFTRYNADTRSVTAYGRQAYRRYLDLKDRSQTM